MSRLQMFKNLQHYCIFIQQKQDHEYPCSKKVSDEPLARLLRGWKASV